MGTDLFFTKLPLELRREVYIHLFGNRRIHIGPVRSPTAATSYPATFYASSWDFISCVCQIHGTKIESTRWPPNLNYDDSDNCLYSKTDLPKQPIGVTAWLLTCHQAYAESIQVLYSTNTFHISVGHLHYATIPQRIPPQGLAMIKTLDLGIGHSHFVPVLPLTELLRLTSKHFPGLVSFHARILEADGNHILTKRHDYRVDSKESLIKAVLQVLDGFVLGYEGQLRDTMFILGRSRLEDIIALNDESVTIENCYNGMAVYRKLEDRENGLGYTIRQY